MVKTDFHTHCLPCIDDGATSPEVSVQMLEMLKKQGIEHVVLSSHFYPQTESLDKFILRRTESCIKLNNVIKGKDIPILSVGAEVNMVRRISEQDLSQLCIENTNLIMLEMPYGPFESWVINELEIIIYEQKLCPIIAHLDRYLAWFKMSDFEDVLSLNDMIYQINVSSFESGKARKFILNLSLIHI